MIEDVHKEKDNLTEKEVHHEQGTSATNREREKMTEIRPLGKKRECHSSP